MASNPLRHKHNVQEVFLSANGLADWLGLESFPQAPLRGVIAPFDRIRFAARTDTSTN